LSSVLSSQPGGNVCIFSAGFGVETSTLRDSIGASILAVIDSILAVGISTLVEGISTLGGGLLTTVFVGLLLELTKT
jgi:hypothetical protein